jgi:hypothetical protein
VKLLEQVLDARWDKFARTVDQNERELGRDLSELLIGDAAELAGDR